MGAPAAPTVYHYTRGSAEAGVETSLKRDVTPLIFLLEPNANPLLKVGMELGKGGIINSFKHEWFEGQGRPDFDTLSAAIDASATALYPSNPSRYIVGDVLLIENLEQVLVTSIAGVGSGYITVLRACGNVAASAHAAGKQIYRVSSSAVEASLVAPIITTDRQPQFNYTQIVQTGWAISNTLIASKLYTGDEKQKRQFDAFLEQRKKIEKMLIHGQRYLAAGDASAGTQNHNMAGGINQFLSTNVFDCGGEMTEDELEDYVRQTFRYNASESLSKLGVASSKAMQVINGFARSKIRPQEVDGKYGVTFNKYVMAGKELKLIEHPLLSNDDQADLSGIAGEMLILEARNIKVKYLEGRAMLYQENTEPNGADYKGYQYLSEMTLELANEAMHGKILNIQG